MTAAVYRRRGELEMVQVAVPEVGPSAVLVEVSHCGICGTDLHSVIDGWGRPDSIGGHEWSGVIAEVGSDVSVFESGDRVIGIAEPGCGTCEACRERRPSLCSLRRSPGVAEFQGAFADFVAVAADAVMRIPEGLTLRDAALAEPLAVALHAVTRAQLVPGERALVSGAGPIGLAAVAVLVQQGVRVTVSEPAELRRTLAGRLGAEPVAPENLVVPPMPNDIVDEPFAAVIECSGRRSAIETCIGQLRRAGRLVVVGTGMDHPTLDVNRVLLNELVITGAFNYDADGFERAIDLLASGAVSTDVLIEPGSVRLDEMMSTMQRLTAGEIGGKVMVSPARSRSGGDDG